jgi:hypothetical protein
MGFLDNSSDIILDAVLTDEGRYRLARGDGSFKIVKFAVADDEIDYSFYDSTNPSGSAFFDLNLLLTPIFEAFTDNAASMKSKCISISRTNLLYLPVLKLQEVGDSAPYSDGTFYVAVNEETETALKNIVTPGLLFGETVSSGPGFVKIDQGLDTSEISYALPLDSDLKETQYILEIDNRFGSISSKEGTQATPSYVDDDDIASYFLSSVDSDYVQDVPDRFKQEGSTISGPRGTRLSFKVRSSIDLNTSDYLLTRLGDSTSALGDGETYRFIDSIIRVTGGTTGISVAVPVRFIKLT